MHPFVLFLYLLGGLIVTMLTLNPALLAVSFAVAAVIGGYFLGRRVWKSVFRLFLPVAVFAAGVLPLFSHNGATPLFYVNSQAFTLENVWYGMVMSLMLVTAFLWFQVGSCLLDAERLFFLFGRTLPSLGLLVSMVFRMLPLLRRRFREIHEAQEGLGFHDKETTVVKRCQRLLRELSTLVTWSLENSIETSLSMESRGYGTGRRTFFHRFRMHGEDAVWCLLFLVLFGVTIAAVWKGAFRTLYFPLFQMEPLGGTGTLGMITFLAAGFLPLCKGGWQRAREGRQGQE